MIFELEVIGIAVNTISGHDAFWNHIESGSTDIVNILKKKWGNTFFAIVFAFIPLKGLMHP